MKRVLTLYSRHDEKLVWRIPIPEHVVAQVVAFGTDDPEGYDAYLVDAFIEPEEEGHA